MDSEEKQLIEVIAQQVLNILQKQGDAAAPTSPRPVPPMVVPASVHPPIGVCTGDYSKFPELAGKTVGAAPARSNPPAPAPPAHEPLPLTGIITADQLQTAMDSAPDRVARLAVDARLTPLANDLARQFPQRIKRVNAQAHTPTATPAPSTWLWWADGPCAGVDDVVAQRRQMLTGASQGRSAASLVQVVRDLAGAVRHHRVAGGILFVATAAKAMCLANRCASLRAVLGTCDEAVEQGVRELGANVLILEYPFVGSRAMAAMVDRFTAQPPQPSPAIERLLADLRRCE